MNTKYITHCSPYGGEYSLMLVYGKYPNGQTKIQLYDAEDGMPYATATSMVKMHIDEDCVVIKNYSENEGILDSLIKAGIVSYPHSYIPSGYINLSVCKLLTKKE